MTHIMNPGIGMIAIADIISFWENQVQEYNQAVHPILCQDQNGNPKKYQVFGYDEGKKYIRVWYEVSGQRSVYCFIDKLTGDIYKSASWKAPAKHVRGNVFNKDYDWGKAVGHYGAVYLK